jgi:Tfp pilus assembly protein PilF
VLLSSVAYANSLAGQFVFDDIEQVVENRDIRSWSNLTRAFTTDVWAFRERSDTLSKPPPLPYYRPIFTVMLTAEYHLFGLWPQGWHLVSLLLHILCSIGVYYVILMMSGRRMAAAIAAAVFAVYPVHAESVSWISGMTDPLFGVFFLASLYSFLKWRERTHPSPSVPGSVLQRLPALSLALFGLALLSKETAISLLVVVFGYEVVAGSGKYGPRIRVAGKRVLPFAVVAAAYLVVRFLALGDLAWSNPQAPSRPLSLTLLTLPWVVCQYVLHLLWPFNLSVTYQTRFITSAGSVEFVVPTMVLAIIAAILIRYRERFGREVGLGLLMLFAPLLPVLNLGQISREEYLIFDHYLYLPVAGWTYLLALVLERLGSLEESRVKSARERPGLTRLVPTPIVGAAGLLVLVLLTVGTARENAPWADSYSLWMNAAKVRPGYWAPHYNAGLALLESERVDEAIGEFEAAASRSPDQPDVYDALGRALGAKGDVFGSVSAFKRALELDPNKYGTINNLGTMLFKAGDYPGAERQFAAALAMRPDAVVVRFNLAQCYSHEGRYSEAIGEFEQVVNQSPDDAAAFLNLSQAYANAGRRADAERALSLGAGAAKTKELRERIDQELRNLKSGS